MKKLKRYKPIVFKAKDSHYDKEAADFAVAFIENLCHTKGTWAGQPFQLLDWQEQIIRDLFGILKPNGYRQFNTAYVEIPKKNGKSELAAAIALLLCCGDGEERAEVYGCAADRQQASIVFEVAADMVRMCPALSKRVKILASQKRIIFNPTNSFYQVLSAEAYSKHGFNIHGVVFDELHTQPNRKLFDVMTKGSGDARMQPLYFLITTAGTDTHSICYETHQKALDILEGRKIDPTFYPVIYGAADNEDWTDPKVWKKANPSLGETIGMDKVIAACESARQNPGEENAFRQLRLNQWVKQAVRWMPMEKWDACASPVNEDDLEGRVCYGGLDLSSTTDITAFVLVFPPTNEDDRYILLPYFWVPEDTLDLRVRRDHVPYDVWECQGFLMTTEGNVVHYFKGLFNFQWKLPEFKLPRINVTWNDIGWGIKLPKLSISWNALGGVFDKPTILGSAAGLQGVGEAGAEAILPLDTLWTEMSARLRAGMVDVLSGFMSERSTENMESLLQDLIDAVKTNNAELETVPAVNVENMVMANDMDAQSLAAQISAMTRRRQRGYGY